MAGDTSNWKELWTLLGTVKYRHIAIDFRGHGKSGKNLSGIFGDRLVHDVLNVADALDVGKFILVGHSFGGKIALLTAAHAKARVSGLILMGAVGPGLVPLERDAVNAILSRKHNMAFVRETFRPWFVVWPNQRIDRWLKKFSQTDQAVHLAVFEIALWTDLTIPVGKLDVPALVIVGREDPVYGPAYQQKFVLPALRRAQLAILNCGHGFVLECPEEIAVQCERFLSKKRTGRRPR